MDVNRLELLRKLVEVGGPSGYEQAVQAVFADDARSHGAEVLTDVIGNVIATLNPGAPVSVMLAGHADEIGFLVRYIDDDGFLYFGAVGGWDPEIAVGQHVTVHSATGPVPGVIGKRAVHLMSAEDRAKKSQLHDFWIDLGVTSRDEAASAVEIGDPVTMRRSMQLLLGDRATAKSFDDRMAVWVCAEVVRLLAHQQLSATLHSVSTVQEEIGLRGAQTAAYSTGSQVGLAIDVCHATDYPDGDKRRVGDIRIGRGPVVSRGANINPRVFELLVKVAREERIPIQIEAAPAGTGTDANVMQISRAGMATGLVSVPLRYMHTPCELLSLTDLENAAKLCAAFVARVSEDLAWTP